MEYDILDVFDPGAKAREMLSMVDMGEIQQWKSHPCTQAILYGLMYDEQAYMLQFRTGRLTAESADGTAQLQAKAIGALEAIEQLKRFIIEEISPYDKSDGTQSPY
jgi:hypothetical protein